MSMSNPSVHRYNRQLCNTFTHLWRRLPRVEIVPHTIQVLVGRAERTVSKTEDARDKDSDMEQADSLAAVYKEGIEY